VKWYKPPTYQFYSFFLSMPFIGWALHYIMFGRRFYEEPQLWLVSYPFVFLLGMGSWYLHYQYDRFIIRKFPSLKDTGKRIAAKLLVYLLVMAPSTLVIILIYHSFHLFGYTTSWEDIRLFLFTGFVVNIIFETLWEVMYMLDKFRESLHEQELLKKMSTEQEFENLKNQVNPHFLFNCFNTLSSLITENPPKAEEFLNELSKVYRYLLNSNETGVSTVAEETRFIESYYRLLKTRHGDGLHMQISIDRKYESYLLPSLSLQLLVENAVKHNVLGKSKPLNIEIFTTPASQLVVNNNLQRRHQHNWSSGIGLSNIKSKYKLMDEEGFQVIEGENHFMVVLPLVWNKEAFIKAQARQTVHE
jgi:sensor histidine kinase YesM